MALTPQELKEIRDLVQAEIRAAEQRMAQLAEQRIRAALTRRTRAQRLVREGFSVRLVNRKDRGRWEQLVSDDGTQIIERRIKQ